MTLGLSSASPLSFRGPKSQGNQRLLFSCLRSRRADIQCWRLDHADLQIRAASLLTTLIPTDSKRFQWISRIPKDSNGFPGFQKIPLLSVDSNRPVASNGFQCIRMYSNRFQWIQWRSLGFMPDLGLAAFFAYKTVRMLSSHVIYR